MKLAKTLITAASVLYSTTAMADTFVLVHGAFQDASSWSAVAADLRSEGHSVVAVDLPGRDAEGEAAKSVSLEAYIETVADAVAAADAPVILVGHSFAGMTITGVADRMPDAIDQLIYVAAYVPQSGESMEALALTDKDNRFTEATFVIAKDYAHAEILGEDQVRVFAQDATPEQAARLRDTMIREPLAPIGTALELSDGVFPTVDMAYVRTLEDGTVSPALQTMMIELAGIENVRDLPTGHAPYLTQPGALADALIELATR